MGFEGSDAELAVEQEQIYPEATLRPREGERVSTAQGDRVWTALKLTDYRLDLNQHLGGPTTNSVAYAVTYIQSDRRQTGLVLRTGSDDLAKVYLNQAELPQRSVIVPWTPPIAVASPLVANSAPGNWIPDEDKVSGVELKAGLNVLVLKLVNSVGRWEGSVWLTDAKGQPVPGIRTTLDPDAVK